MISKMPGPTRPRYLAAARPTDQLRVNSASGHHYSPGVARRTTTFELPSGVFLRYD